MEYKNYIGYEYTEIKTSAPYSSMYLDSYLNFGWIPDENYVQGSMPIRLKRDRKILNKAELTRLQRHFDACMEELMSLEKARETRPTMAALAMGLIGTAFIAGSVFAITAQTPIVWLCIVLAIPGFIGWAVPMFLHKYLYKRESEKMKPLIEAKYDELYEIGEKAIKLQNS